MHIHGTDDILDVLTIRYVVPHTPSDLQAVSPLQMISPGIAETVNAFERIAVLPRDASELIVDSSQLIGARIAGRGLSVLPVPLDLLSVVISTLADRIVVVVSVSGEIADLVQRELAQHHTPILHVTPQSPGLDRAAIRRHCVAVALSWNSVPGMRSHAKALSEGLTNWRDPLGTTELAIRDRNHLLTAPNISTLASAGYRPVAWDGKPLAGTNNTPYFEALRESIAPITAVRDLLIKQHPMLGARSRTDLIVTVPGVIKGLHSKAHRDLPGNTSLDRRNLASVLKQIVSRTEYNFTLRVPEGMQTTALLASPHIQSLMATHRMDLGSYTAMLSIRAASSFVPVVRLPPSSNSASSEVSQLADACRSSFGRNPHKLNRLANNMSRRLSRELPDWLIQHIRTSTRIKLVADSPLEWMDIDGFPLMLRADVSRIPVTPGNLFVQSMLQCSERALPADRFRHVLVIRSFLNDDPIRGVLENATKTIAIGAQRFPEVQFVDVKTRRDLIHALREYDGAILVYDGHGAHGDCTDVGQLVLADERVDPWTLRGEVRVPPIVLMSACDTHPFGASHATAANGFLAAGALTVVGTSISVGAINSAVMMARLILRVGDYLPLLIEQRPWKSFRWSEIFPGLQRRQYTTEVLHRLCGVGGMRIAERDCAQIMMDVGMEIESGRDWHSRLLDHIALIGGCSAIEAKERVQTQAGFVEALAYTQLGNPELVVGYEMSPKPSGTELKGSSIEGDQSPHHKTL